MPTFGQLSDYPLTGSALILPHKARHWAQSQTKDGSNVVTSTGFTDAGLIPGHLQRNVNQAILDELGITITQGGLWRMPLELAGTVKEGDELQIDGNRWEVVNRPQRANEIQNMSHCYCILRRADL